jgi:enoyl-CoA hydratase/carnithine racemase
VDERLPDGFATTDARAVGAMLDALPERGRATGIPHARTRGESIEGIAGIGGQPRSRRFVVRSLNAVASRKNERPTISTTHPAAATWLKQQQRPGSLFHHPAQSCSLQEVLVNAISKTAQIKLTRPSAAWWRITFDNPPLNLMGPEFVLEFREIMTALETDEQVKVVVFASAVEGFFLNHSDFLARLEDLTSIPQGPTGLEAWPDILVRLTRAPVVTIASIRGRATGNGSELALACDMSFASREKAILSQWEVGVGLVAGGGPMARLPRLIGRGRALEVLLASEDIGGDLAQTYGYVNRSLPDAELDLFVDGLAARVASFDKWAIANTKRLVNAASLPPDVEMAAGWEACMASIVRPAAQDRIKTLFEQGFHKPGDAEDRLGSYLGRLGG